MSKSLKIRRSISQRDNEEAVSWFLTESFDGLGTAGQGNIANVIDKIVEAHEAGYEIIMQDTVENGFTSVSLSVRDAVRNALLK